MNHPQPVSSSSIAQGLCASGLECIRGDNILFSDLDLAVGPGEILLVNGDNGSGKTSLLRILCGLALPERGRVLWNGAPIEKVRNEFHRALCYIGHLHAIKGELSVAENLRLAAMLGGNRIADTDTVLGRIGLTGMQDRPCAALSAGQRRRVALARLLTGNARLWILDEPFTALDAQGRALIESLLREHAGQGGMAIMTSHHPVALTGTRLRILEL